MASGPLFVKLISIALALLTAAWLSFSGLQATDVWWKKAICGATGLASIGIAVVFAWIASLNISPYYDVISTLRHLFEVWSVYSTGKHQLKQMRATWTDLRSSQEDLLLNILRKNSQTAYGKDFKLHEIRSMKDFRGRHPLTSFENFRAYAARAMEGEGNVMTPTAPRSFVRTTGTTGQSKYIPLVDRLYLLKTMFGRTSACAFENCPRLGLMQKQFLFYVAPKITKAKSGASIESFLTLSPEEEYKLAPYCSPPAGFHIGTLKDACYIHCLYAIREPTIGVVFSFFIHYIESMMKLLERRWSDIIDDIAHGTIHEDVQLEDDIRTSLIAALGGGDQERAGQLRREFEKGMDGILKRVWPNMAIVIGIDNTGSWPEIERKYAKGIPLLPFVYGSSEGIIGQGLWTEDRRKGYSLVTNEIVYEFIKFEDTEQNQPKTYLPDELEIGQRYELVLTQISGLYRYRMGDIIRVTGYERNRVPVIEFQYRLGLMLNVRFEKLDQLIVKETVKSSVAMWSGVKLIDYAVAENNLITEESSAYEKDEIMPYYLVFIELEIQDRDTPITQEERQMIDLKFKDLNSDYVRLRHEGSISHPRIHIVKPGTFEDLKHYILTHTNASANQYKVPRKLRTYGMLQVMLDHIEV